MAKVAHMSDRRELRAAVEHAFDWVIENRAHFVPSTAEQLIDTKQVKPLIELAIMLNVHARLARVDALASVLDPIEVRRKFRDRRIRSRTDIVIHAFLYAVLRHGGHDDEQQRELIQSAVDARLLDHVERTPHQIMEERLALELGAFSNSLQGWQELVDLSILANTPSPLHLDERAAYHVTHVILYMFGFGTAAEPSAHVGDLPGLRRLLSALILTFCADRNWDLVGELLLCWDCLELEPSLVYDRAWDALLSRQAADGSFPGPERSKSSNKDGCSDLPDDRRRFLERYHTTLVAIMACDRNLRRVETIPPVSIPARPPHHPTVSDQGLMATAEKDAQWLIRLFDRLSERNELRPNAACSVLVGTWVCAAINCTVASALPELADRVAASLSTVGEWIDVPPTLTIITNALLADHGIILPGLATFVRTACAALDAHGAVDAVSDLMFCEKRVLFNQLGWVKPPMLLEPRCVVHATRAFPLDGSRPAVETLLLHLGSVSGYGTRSIELDVDKGSVGELLAALTVRFFRCYDFITATKLLRTAVYLQLDAKDRLVDLIEFILLQHRPEGGYGFFAAQEASVKETVGKQFSADRDLYLPVTLNCLCALAEATSEWRLYGNLRGLKAGALGYSSPPAGLRTTSSASEP